MNIFDFNPATISVARTSRGRAGWTWWPPCPTSPSPSGGEDGEVEVAVEGGGEGSSGGRRRRQLIRVTATNEFVDVDLIYFATVKCCREDCENILYY